MDNIIFSCSSITDKTTGNQDYCCKVVNEQKGFKGIIIADGIGSHKMSELSSEFCSEQLKIFLEKLSGDNEIDFKALFSSVKTELIKYVETIDKEAYDVSVWQLGTTLICALAFKDHYLIAYTGNGSVWYTTAGFDELSASIYTPWNSVNLLNPHSVESEGKAALTNYISVTEAPETPVVIKLSRDTAGKGEMLILTTDGIFSNDSLMMGKDEESRAWLLIEKNMTSLYNAVNGFLKVNPNEKGDDGLEISLREYLENLKENNLIYDDATVGVIISSNAAKYYQNKWDKQNKYSDEANKIN